MAASRHDEWIVVTEDAKTLPVVEILTGRGFVTGKSGSGKSVLEGTIVYTEDGRKPIEAVDPGDRVLSLDQASCEGEFREVLATLEHEADNLLRITLEDGTEIVGTADHSFLTIDDTGVGPIKGEDVREGTWFPCARQLPSPESIEQLDLAVYAPDRCKVGEHIIRDGALEQDRYLQLDFETGQLCGLYLGVGRLAADDTIRVTTEGRRHDASLAARGFDVDGRTGICQFTPLGACLRTAFGSGPARKRVPDWAFEAPRSFKRGLISGFVDVAGTVEHTLVMEAASPTLLTGVSELLTQFGVACTVDDRPSCEQRRARLTVEPDSRDRLASMLELTATDTAAALAQQRATLDEQSVVGGTAVGIADGQQAAAIVGERRVAPDSNGSERMRPVRLNGGQAASPDVRWQRVVEVEPLSETRTVYDLDVRCNDTFIANGVYVHNSNTGSVIAEELLSNGYNLLIVDTEGEYFGLKEEFELLHVGADEFADVEVSPSHAKKIAEIAIKRNMPVILDVSGFFDGADAEEMITRTLEHIYRIEKDERKPMLVMVEEMQEYLPQKGGGTELARLLERIAKRGRKRGLGICGMSQRPSSVDKDFITQCDWMVWHRLTWETDVNVVRNILGSDRADDIQEFDPGEGILMTDWDDMIETVQFKRKRTHDAGATPGLESYERPDLQAVGSELIQEIKGKGAAAEFTRPAEEADLDAEAEPDTGDEREEGLPTDEPEDASPPDEPEELATVETADVATSETDPSLVTTDRAELLEAEVKELRSILDGVEGNGAAPTIPEPEDDTPTIEPPMPPGRPRTRDGLPGMLVEFGQLMVYLVRSAWYRVRLRYHNRRPDG